jgi:integrase
MKKPLTALAIRALKPQAKPYYVGDAKQDGLRVRVACNGQMTWNVTVRQKGGRIVSTSLGRCDPDGRQGLDLLEARGRAAQIVKAARSGVDLVASEEEERQAQATAVNILTLIEGYSNELANPQRKGGALRTAEETRRRLKRSLATKLMATAKSINRRDLSRLLDEIAQEYPREAEKRRQAIGAMFAWAVAKGHVESSPAAGIPSYGASALKDRVLDSTELRVLWRWLQEGADGMPPDVVAVLKIQLLTGARVGEIAGMDALELEDRGSDLVWTLPAARSKNKRPHTRPLLGLAKEVVSAKRKLVDDGPLFRTLDGSRSLRSDDVGLALNHRQRPISHFTTHDLRRTVVSGLDELGVALDTIAAVIGHQRGGRDTRTLIRHYSRPNLDERIGGALALWNDHFKSLIGPNISNTDHSATSSGT